MKQNPNRLWIVVLLLGWAFDFLFWNQPVGINFAIFIALCLLGGLGLLLVSGCKPALRSLSLLLPVGFFTAITFIRQEPLTLILAYAFSILCLGLLAVTYLGGRWMQYSLADYLAKFYQLARSLFTLPAEFNGQVRRERAARGEVGRKWPVRPVVRGMFLAFPILGIFTYLLSSADLVFNQMVEKFFEKFNFWNSTRYSLRLVIILVCAYGLAGVILHAAARSRDEKLLGEDRPVVKPMLGFTEAAVVLGSVAILFLAFVIIQFQYFFGGQANIGVAGYTYSEYARRGFNELLIVAFLSLLLTLGLSVVTRRANTPERRVYSGLCVTIAAEVMVILVSAYQRLLLAMDWHGFSRLRLYPSVFLVWMGILFGVVVVLEILHHERYFACAALLAALGFAVSISLLNVDAAIVRRNVFRATEGRYFNVNHLTTLSTDAVPALVETFHDRSLPPPIHEGIGAALLCYTRSVAIANDRSGGWRSFNLSRQEAIAALASVTGELVGYKMNVEENLVRVGTPIDLWFECAQ